MSAFLLSAAGVSAATSVLIALMLLLRRFGNRFTARSRYFIWLLVMLRLLIPVTFGSALFEISLPSAPAAQPVSPVAELPTAAETTPSAVASAATGVSNDMPQSNGTLQSSVTSQSVDMQQNNSMATTPVPENAVAVNAASGRAGSLANDVAASGNVGAVFAAAVTVGAWIWLAGALGFFAVRLGGHLLCMRSLRRSLRSAPAEVSERCSRLCTAAGIRRTPGVYISGYASSPMLAGLVKPRVILPPVRLDDEQLDGVLAHELIHYRRHDLAVKLLALAALSLHWCNPLAHAAASRLAQEMELSCDEAVLRGSDDRARIAYGGAMLTIVKNCAGSGDGLTTHFNPRRNAVKERFYGIMDMTKKKRGIWIIAAVALLCIVVGAVIGCNGGEKSQTSAAGLEKYSAVLNNENKLYDIVSDKEVYFSEFTGIIQGETVSKFTLTDLNADNSPEMVLWLTNGADEYLGFDILFTDGDTVCCFSLPYRSFQQLKADGTFDFSSGASDSGIGRLALSDRAYSVEKIAFCETSYDSDGSISVSYYIGNTSVSKAEYETESTRQTQKADAVWREYAETELDSAIRGDSSDTDADAVTAEVYLPDDKDAFLPPEATRLLQRYDLPLSMQFYVYETEPQSLCIYHADTVGSLVKCDVELPDYAFDSAEILEMRGGGGSGEGCMEVRFTAGKTVRYENYSIYVGDISSGAPRWELLELSSGHKYVAWVELKAANGATAQLYHDVPGDWFLDGGIYCDSEGNKRAEITDILRENYTADDFRVELSDFGEGTVKLDAPINGETYSGVPYTGYPVEGEDTKGGVSRCYLFRFELDGTYSYVAGVWEHPDIDGIAGADYFKTVLLPVINSFSFDAASAAAKLAAVIPPSSVESYGEPALDADAYIAWLSDYAASKWSNGNELVLRMNSLAAFAGEHIDAQNPPDRGTATLYFEYYRAGEDICAATKCGGGAIVAEFSGTGAAQVYTAVNDELLGGLFPDSQYEPAGIADGAELFVLDTNNRVWLRRADGSKIQTPAYFYGDIADLNTCYVLNEGTDRLLVAGRQSTFYNTDYHVYASFDGGAHWSISTLDYTPVTIGQLYPVTDAVVSFPDEKNGAIILGTNRAELFVYRTSDGGAKWRRVSNFKLLNYRVSAQVTGGFVSDDVGIICLGANDVGNPNIYVSRDGGVEWERLELSPPDGYDASWQARGLTPYLEGGIIKLVISSVTGTGDLILRSDDMGASWKWE